MGIKHNVFVGNLPLDVTEEALTDMVKLFGAVQSVHLVTDRTTGRSRGFAFVEMAEKEEGAKAIKTLNGKDLGGRKLRANWARRGEKVKFEERDRKR
jgi:RNA recognition motif-containing protein